MSALDAHISRSTHIRREGCCWRRLAASRSRRRTRTTLAAEPSHRGRAQGACRQLARLPGGWTADSVGATARKTSFELAAKEASVHAADSIIESSNIQLHSAEEAYRARRELFRYRKGTSVELADAKGNLFRARLAATSAGIDLGLARVRIEHATGRDVTRGGT